MGSDPVLSCLLINSRRFLDAVAPIVRPTTLVAYGYDNDRAVSGYVDMTLNVPVQGIAERAIQWMSFTDKEPGGCGG